MTQAVPSLEVVQGGATEAPRPLDAHFAEGIAINGLFCAAQQRQVIERFGETFGLVQNDEKPHRHRSYTIAMVVGRIPLKAEEEIDSFMCETAKVQNHGTVTGRLEPTELGDIVWKGYDPNSSRFMTLFKRTSQTIMTDGSLPYATMWELKAHPKP